MAQDERVSVDLYIDGEWRPARSGARFDLIDPAREEIVGTAARAGAEDTRDAIAAAVRGFEVWRGTPAWERSRMLRRIAALLSERAEKVARQIVLETGKTIAISRGEVASIAASRRCCAISGSRRSTTAAKRASLLSKIV